MPRVDVNVQCEFDSGVDMNTVGRAISQAIKSLTGNPCQAVVNSRDKSGQMSRVNMWKMQQSMRRGSVELRP